jgi:predicted GNAT family N-acyltransferase
MIIVKLLAFGSPEQLQTLALRDAILRQPLGLVFDPAELPAEAAEIHLAAYSANELVGVLLLRPLENGAIKMRQVAVATAAQGQGVGRALVHQAEATARSRGFGLMELNARQTAVDFYLVLGYEAVGEPFTEVGIPHRKMQKQLL